MQFVGSTIIYSYLQAIGVINSHEKNCEMHRNDDIIKKKNGNEYEKKNEKDISKIRIHCFFF